MNRFKKWTIGFGILIIAFFQNLHAENKGPSLYWNFDKENATVEKDESGHNYNGLIKGKPVWVDGVKGKALLFSEKSTFLISENAEKLNNTQATVMFWFKPLKWDTQGNTFINKGWNWGWGIDPHYWGDNIHICAFAGERKDFSLKENLPINKWSHIAVCFDGKNGINVYVAGERKNSAFCEKQGMSNSSWSAVSDYTELAAPIDSDGCFLQLGGSCNSIVAIDEFKIYDRVLDSAEIKMHTLLDKSEVIKKDQLGNPELLSIVNNRRPASVILLEKNCPEITRFAAGELQAFIQKMTGAVLPIIPTDEKSNVAVLSENYNLIFVGKSKAAEKFGFSIPELKPDGFKISTKPGALLIAGADDRRARPAYYQYPGSSGTLYGVYRFLNDQGIRWFFPGNIGEVVPHKTDIAFTSMDITDSPYFIYRNALPEAGMDYLWLRRVGFGAAFYPGSICHISSLGLQNYFTLHPEWFALDEAGTRKPFLCGTNPEVRAKIIKTAKRFAEKSSDLYPDFMIMEEDGAPPPCECELCKKKLTPKEGRYGIKSDYWAEVAIETANAIKNCAPDKTVNIGAYNQQLRPPLNIKQLPANVSVQIAMHRFYLWDKESQYTSYDDILDGWLKLKPKFVCLWQYYNFDCWGGGRWFGVPAVATEMIARDIRKLQEMSQKSGIPFFGEMIFSNGRKGPLTKTKLYWLALDCYITARFQWNPQADREAILRDFYEKYFGPAAGPMKEFYSYAESVWNQGGGKWGKNGYGRRANLLKGEDYYERNPWDLFFTPEVLKKMDDYLKVAEKAATQSPYKERVKMIRDCFNVTLSQAAKNIKVSQDKVEKENTIW